MSHANDAVLGGKIVHLNQPPRPPYLIDLCIWRGTFTLARRARTSGAGLTTRPT